MIGPYTFIRLVTFGLATTWSAFGLVRIVRFAAEVQEKLAPLGLPARWWRRQIAIACLRATVLDPVNLALLCLLVGLWTVPAARA